jgi:hypothetical protein
MTRKVRIEEQNGINWQVTEFDLDKLLDNGRVTTENDNGWKRKIKLVKD